MSDGGFILGCAILACGFMIGMMQMPSFFGLHSIGDGLKEIAKAISESSK